MLPKQCLMQVHWRMKTEIGDFPIRSQRRYMYGFEFSTCRLSSLCPWSVQADSQDKAGVFLRDQSRNHSIFIQAFYECLFSFAG